LKIFNQTVIFYFQSNPDFKFSIAIMIAIEKPIRINQTLIIFEKSHNGFHPPKHGFPWKPKTKLPSRSA